MSTTSSAPAFRDTIGCAVSLLWSLAYRLPEIQSRKEHDRLGRFQAQRLATDALLASMLGRCLVGEREVEEPWSLGQSIGELPRICQNLIDLCDLEDVKQVDFAGRVADIHRGVKHLGLLG
ncbi:hypothetical protein ASD11_14525 [Aeromicrobium sp. Root495]|uniref:hypothetical protein n=1 Tax=Aeromicrobium sp. Root495 TaxID=1736550 RepID=UPI0006FCC686|nr:hypothetical protein [Aeromicrobium sp. Root495]KQY55724.1 hypothetical protein ASD11_14525 [Aeromicrobium sp. Root495]